MRHLVRLAALWLAASPMLHAAEYRYVRIHVPGSIETRANGINARGDIVGFYTDAEGALHAFLRRQTAYTSIQLSAAQDNGRPAGVSIATQLSKRAVRGR